MKHKAKSSSGISPPKGKGKGKDKSGGETIDLKDFPFRFSEFSNGDHSKVVPRYSAVLRRSDHDGIGMEDIDALQLELEALLSSTVVRKTTITDEMKALSNIEKYKGQAGRLGKRGPLSPGKRGSSTGKDSGRSAKKLKPSPTEGSGVPGSKVVGVPKFKASESSNATFDPLQNEQIRPVAESAKPALPKNETPNRFWAFVEPYCAPITNDDIKLLEDLIKTHGDMSEYYRVPKLGQHYTERWAREDLESERAKSSGPDSSLTESPAESSPFGELTQRLVAGLMEETAASDATGEAEASDADPGKKEQLIRSLSIGNADALEARVRKELEEQGVLDTENGDPGEPDEILDELSRCQAELRAVSAHNLQQLKRLLKAGRDEMGRQELREKLNRADTEVMEAYRKISAARSKKKPPSKKEREQAWKALKEREIILRQLEAV